MGTSLVDGLRGGPSDGAQRLAFELLEKTLERAVCLDAFSNVSDFGDSLDLTHKVAGRWDAGVSSSVYRQDTGWSHLTGPVVHRSDARGSWALSVRSGYDTEVRLVRILTFGE